MHSLTLVCRCTSWLRWLHVTVTESCNCAYNMPALPQAEGVLCKWLTRSIHKALHKLITITSIAKKYEISEFYALKFKI